MNKRIMTEAGIIKRFFLKTRMIIQRMIKSKMFKTKLIKTVGEKNPICIVLRGAVETLNNK